MFDELYTSKILERAAALPKKRRIPGALASAHKKSRLCGSEVTVDINAENGRITEFVLEARACALGQCAASIMAAKIVGSTFHEMRDLRDAMRAMLKEGGPPPEGRWEELSILEPVKEYRPRHASTLLVFEAVVDCIDQIETGAAASTQAVAVT